MKQTIAHLLPDYNPFPPRYPAGTELRVEQVAQRQQRYRPVVVCGWFAGQAESEAVGTINIRRIRVGRAYRRLFQKITRVDPLPYGERMWRVIQNEGAALLHIHNEPKLLAGMQARLRHDPRPVIVHVANEKPLPAGAMSRVTQWVACSQYIARWLIDHNGIDPNLVEVIYTGVDSRARAPGWQTSDATRNLIRERFGVTRPDVTVLLFAGRLVREKGVVELLDAFEQLRAVHGDKLELLIAGNVRDSDDPRNEKAVYGKAVVARIEQTPGARWVGSLPPQDMHEFLIAGDIFVLPSLWADPFPTVMLEAAAAGIPIVAAARGGMTEFLADCPGFDADMRPEDPESLSSAIERYLLNEESRRVAGNWLRARVEAQFDWSRVCNDMEDLYDRLLKPGTPRP